MKTEKVMLQDLCVPCANRCRHCLLSWTERTVGVPWEQAADFALRFKAGLQGQRPELEFSFTFGYSMEHPELEKALRFLRETGSPQAEFLQCDGMDMRGEAECAELVRMLEREGVKHLNFTLYGLEEQHDRFAHRAGDYALIFRMLRAAREAGLMTSAGIMLTNENAGEAEELLSLLRAADCGKATLIIPHGEGRGGGLESLRLTGSELMRLPESVRGLINGRVFRTEGEWVSGGYEEETKRQLIISLRRDNFERYSAMEPEEIVAEAEELDDNYYAAFPGFYELAERYGDPAGDRLFSQRDIFHYYRRLYAADTGLKVYDVTDERQTGSRRY